MYWLRWHYHVKDIAGAPYKIKKKSKANKTTESPRQSVVAGGQQLYCTVQSRSSNRRRTTTGKVQSSARDGTSSATVHSWQTTAGRSTHVPKPLGRHGHRALKWRDKKLDYAYRFSKCRPTDAVCQKLWKFVRAYRSLPKLARFFRIKNFQKISKWHGASGGFYDIGTRACYARLYE